MSDILECQQKLAHLETRCAVAQSKRDEHAKILRSLGAEGRTVEEVLKSAEHLRKAKQAELDDKQFRAGEIEEELNKRLSELGVL